LANRFTENDGDVAKQLLVTPTDWLESLPAPETIGDEVWQEKRVDLETWLYDPMYMNLSIRLSDVQFGTLEAMDNIDPLKNVWTEFVCLWGKGAGKDFIAALASLRQVYNLLCLRSPYEFYGMAKNTGIQIVNVAYTKEQAQFVFLKQVKGLIRGSRWFMKHAPEITRTRIKFPYEIEFMSASSDGDSVEGQNIFFAVMDEASAFKTGNNVKAMNKAEGTKAEHDADTIYNVLRTSSNSRFPGIGKVVIISYPRYKDDFTETKLKENQVSPRGWTSGPLATWDVNPRVKKEDFAEDYARNPEKAKAMYECIAPYAEDGYVKEPVRFLECAARGGAMGLKEPFDDKGAYDLDFRGLPGRYYAIHVDLALNRDKCAIALGRQGEPVRRLKCPCNTFNYRDNERCVGCGRPREQWNPTDLPTCIVTLLKQFKPGEKGEVNFADVRDEILWIRERSHFIWALSYDGWQSVDSRQIMSDILGKKKVRKSRWGHDEREEDIVSLLSVDRNTEAHDTLKELIYDGRFYIYAGDGNPKDDDCQSTIAQAFREWRSLRLINGKKVDHPLGGAKDLCDALAGVAYHVTKMPISRMREPTFGGWQENAIRK